MTQPPDPAAVPEPPYPAAPPPPRYPTAAPPPQYSSAPSPPQYPTAVPPAYSTPLPPAYPTAPSPAYPAAGPTPPVHPAGPGTPPPAGTAGVAPGVTAAVPSQPTGAPDDLDYRHAGSRIHVAEHQRGADATAIGRLLIHVPGLLVSLAVVATVAEALAGPAGAWVTVLLWLASGAFVFHRPTELAFARHVLTLRAPLADERARLEPVWREVTARAGIEAHSYELMVENSTELNASAVAGHVVSVTTYALNEIPSSNLAAVLAHELGHHTGGHAWAGLLGYWYSLPGRAAWALTKRLARFALVIASVFSAAATGVLVLFMGVLLTAGMLVVPYITVPLVLAPYLLAYMGRKGELRADQQAADLGFAGQMTQVLYRLQAEEDALEAHARATGQRLEKPGRLARLLSTHPDNPTRIRALEPYLRTGL
ncbi:M48 family metalloprotease [Streptomyces sp. JB150]|uniref:M48 family metalloprotease n=1 Tax=Streptomyces sp. JB150 TaxID=2714844 RepID=UPI001408669D|nr:M48 family metalloprotease [Streptomyces sp. JB150]QIJ64186.1 M48 family metalloprotease [Streptomyces sp. JB150]